ncbi:class F sortase [Streptomyces sp. MAR4 CNX-425]|uniref:class F sortase n=1 Tax=Streptomyces sp. MAR4 CNX-425 TaxID=3406343 RepID=UPI003B511F0D
MAAEPARRRPSPVTVAAWAALLLGLWLWGRGLDGGEAGGTLSDAAAGAQVLRDGPPAARPLPGRPDADAVPAGVAVPSVGVAGPVVGRGLDEDGAVAAPPFGNANEIGWYRGGARPGAAGVAVFVGHVDTRAKPAVFYRLGDVRPGEEVTVTRADGRTAVFTVERVETVAKDDFDAQRVYGQHKRGRAEIRLLTCGGAYEPGERTYTGNVVVSGYLTRAT